MKKVKYLNYLLLLIFFFVFSFSSFGKGVKKGKRNHKANINKITGDPSQSVISINNITTWVGDDGFHDWVVGGGSWNGAFPNGAAAGGIFSEGIVWGGKVNDGQNPTVRVNGNTYGTGCAPITRLYRVRPDYKTGDLTRDAADFFSKGIGEVTDGDIAQLRAQYAKDWNEWPADQGAMYKDVNGDGKYEPDVDVPGVPGASQTIFIKYNDANSASLYASPPIGLEVTETYWAYSFSGPLGNVIYKKVDMVYKGTSKSAANSQIDSMYIVQWADPDNGNSTDDFAGSDTTLNLGYAYNASNSDAVYDGLGLAPPAVGYDFLQGVSKFTGNPNDSAIFNLKWRKGYAYVNPKPMSSFAYFAAGGTWSDPDFNYNGSLQFYNLMRGYLPRPEYPSASPFPTSVADVTPFGTYLVDGDPVAGTGKLDGTVDGPSDRRIMVTNGPITLNLGDTAEVVVALVGGLGNSNLNSVAVLKNNDNSAQIVFDQLFKLPSINPPDVTVTNLHNKVLLNWGNNQSSVDKIENFSDQGYSFEGYIVYQLPSPTASLSDGVVLGTYDLVDGVTSIYDEEKDANGVSIPKLVVDGKDKGIKRFIEVTSDPFRGTALRDGQAYYFAVVAYAYNPNAILPFHALKSAAVTLSAVPQQPDPGIRYGSAFGDTLVTKHAAGASDGNLVAVVVDPSKLTGMNYKVTFATDTTTGNPVWNVTRSDGKVVIANATDQNADAASPIADGIQFLVSGAPLDYADFYVNANANGPLDPPAGAAADYYGFPGLGRTNIGNQQANGSAWFINSTDAADPTYARFKFRTTQYSGGFGEPDQGLASLVPDDFEIRFTATGSKAFFGFGATNLGVINVPFEIWDVGDPNDPSDDFQMFAQILDFNDDGVFDYSGADHAVSSSDNDPYTDGIYSIEPLDRTPGSAGYNALVAAAQADPAGFDANQAWAVRYDGPPYNSKPGFMRLVFVNWNGGTVPSGPFNALMPETGTVFHIATTKPNTSKDEFDVTAPKNINDQSLAKADLNKINVFPNPYYGYQYRETSRDGHYVTFNHLPNQATIRIFDLSGVLVKTINHVSTSGQFDRWNLQNDSGLPVASGIYIVYIDMPKFGATKVLKLAVVQEQQILKVY